MSPNVGAVQCSTAGWGCIDCKKVLHTNMIEELTPIQARAKELKTYPKRVDEALASGTEKCSRIARQTIGDVRQRMGID